MVLGGKVPSERVEFIDLSTLFNNWERFSFIQGQNLPFWEKNSNRRKTIKFPTK